MDDPQGPASVVKTAREAVGTQTTTSEPTLNPKPVGLHTPDALSDKASPAISTITGQHHLEIDMEPVPVQQVARQDTLDSLQSSFGRRTNTIFSMASITSDITEVTEPDNATIHDELEEPYASAARSSTFPCRSDSFHSPPPSRTSSLNVVDPDIMGPARSTAPSDIRPLTHPEVLRLRELASSPKSNTGRQGRGPSHPVSMPFRPKTSEGTSSPQRSALGRQDDNAISGPSSLPGTSTPAVTESPPSQSMAISTPGSQSEAEWPHEDPEDWAMDASQRPDENVIQEACDGILKQVFGVELIELVDTGAAPEAYRSVSYCLDELSRILAASNIAAFSTPVTELGRGGGEQNYLILPAGDGADQNGQGANGGPSRRPLKRGPSDEGDQDQDGFDEGGSPGGPNGNGKKAKVASSEDQRLSCPFRKRNPVKFNVRDHQNCAVQSFPDVSQLKRHVKLFHKQKTASPFDCPRCKKNMGAKETLQNHLAVSNDSICTFQEMPSSQDPEDGINAKIEDVLNGRRANTKVDQWEILWHTLFPNDDPAKVPDSVFVPPIELDEVYADFVDSESCRGELKKRISDEDLGSAEFEGRIVEICDDYIDWVFKRCRDNKIGNLPYPARRKRAQKLRGPRGQKDATRLEIPATISNQPSFNGSNDDPGSASDLDTPRSNQSWANAFASQPGMPTTSLANVPPALVPLAGNGFHDFDVSRMDASGLNSPLAMAQPDTHLGFPNQPQAHHHRQPSGDSGVSFEGTLGFDVIAIHQRQPGFGPHGQQMPFHGPGFMPHVMPQGMPQGMPTNGRGHGHFQNQARIPIHTSVPAMTRTGPAPTGMESTLFSYSSPLDHNGFGRYSPDGGLGNMDETNHL